MYLRHLRKATTTLSRSSTVFCHRHAVRHLGHAQRQGGPSTSHVVCGIVTFVAAERATAAALSTASVDLPPSVTALCMLGVVASSPTMGVSLQRALGPATAWLRTALPFLLVPAFLCPVVVDLPDSDALLRLAALATGATLLTCAATGHVASLLVRGPALSIPTPCSSTMAAATAAFTSWRTAALGAWSRT